MYHKNHFKYPILVLLFLCFWTITVMGADPQGSNKSFAKRSHAKIGPIVEDDWAYHRIGTIWSRVTNFGKTGDDSYENRTPSGDWPGGSGNSYLYRGSLWLTARVDGVIHSTQPEDTEYAPIDSVHVITGDDARAEQDTYTKYYDVVAPLASGHFPLGLEVTERTFSWSESFRDDFIIYEYTVKNVGIDSDGDGYPDTPRDLDEFYFTWRLDGDVSKLSNWPTEGAYVHRDDHAACNASWDFIDLFPQWAGVDHGLTDEQADSAMIFMWDGDDLEPSEMEGIDDDSGNPSADGTLQSPGFLGFKILKTDPPTFQPTSFHTNHIYNDPNTDQESYDRMMKPQIFEGILVDPSTGKAFPNDYRAIITLGPLETLAAGDSVVVTAALGVGCDPERGGIYSLMTLVEIMDMAQRIIDKDYAVPFEPPTAPGLEVMEHVVNGVTEGVKVVWDNSAEFNENFQGYNVWKSSGKTASGAFDWSPLGAGTYKDSTDGTWPPPAGDDPGTYQLIDNDITNGFDYYYAVEAFTSKLPQPFGRMESNRLNTLKVITPANPVADDLSNVKVVPNPYIGSVAWNNSIPSDADPWEHRLQFINLPADATIKIFTLDGDYVDEIKAGQSARKSEAFAGASSMSVAEWDLITRNNQDAAPGIYIYVVDSPSAGTKTGKFVIIR